MFFPIFITLFFHTYFYFPGCREAVVTGVVPSLPRVLAFSLYRT